MGTDAIALLRGADDGVALHPTLARWAGSDEELALALRMRLGAELDAHEDPRGVLVFPDVASPRATTYEGVIAEMGAGARWIPIVAADCVPTSLRSAPTGSTAHLMGELLGALDDATRAALQRAIPSGDPTALAEIERKMASTLGGREQMDAMSARITAAAQAEAPAYAAEMERHLGRR